MNLVGESDPSMTDQEDEKNNKRGTRRTKSGDGKDGPNMKQVAGNITNIINNNNINNYIINDTSKTPNQFMMQQQNMNGNRVSTAPAQIVNQGSNQMP